MTLREYFNANQVDRHNLFGHYCVAYSQGITRSFSSFKRHFYLWAASLKAQHVPPPVATAPLQEAYA
jgi:hypothetical protein